MAQGSERFIFLALGDQMGAMAHHLQANVFIPYLRVRFDDSPETAT